MSSAQWPLRTLPARAAGATVVGRWTPVGLADLTADRRRLAVALRDGARYADAGPDAIDRLLITFEELTSNALRHGRSPIWVTVTAGATSWLLEVGDAATSRPPAPAIGRDPSQGGLGLHLVASLCGDYGWDVQSESKVVWARVDFVHAHD